MTRAKITRFKVFLMSSLLVLLPSLCLAQETYIWTGDDMKRIEDKPSKTTPMPAPDSYSDQEQDKDMLEQEKALDQTEEPEAQQRAKEEKEQQAAEIEKARREYEEAKKSERLYHIRNKYIDNRRSKYLWRQSQQRLEKAKQHLEELKKTQ